MQGTMKVHNTVKLLIVILVLAGSVIVVSPINNLSAGQKGNEAKGRYYFRQTCKTCHTKEAKGGEITPLSKTQAQWQAYFTKGKHAKGSEPLTKVMTEDQLRDLQTYLVAHAADSSQPETCGKN